MGRDPANEVRGGIEGIRPEPTLLPIDYPHAATGKPSRNLGKTTGWIHRATLKNKKVRILPSVEYLKIDDEGFHIRTEGKQEVLNVDNVIICAGQVPRRDLQETLKRSGVKFTSSVAPTSPLNWMPNEPSTKALVSLPNSKFSSHLGSLSGEKSSMV